MIKSLLLQLSRTSQRLLHIGILGVCGTGMSFSPSISAQVSSLDLFDLDLEELLKVKVQTGQLFGVERGKSSSALTVIPQEHIRLSTAKNLAELLEIYVPGLMLMAHSAGDKIGLRGHIAAENYKLLLLVNGKNITNMVYEGAILELDQWSLGDIEKVEVVRGPGSVVYGTGAIAGVINIITKSPDKNYNGISYSNNAQYRSQGISLQWSPSTKNFSSTLFASIQRTDGLENPDYYIPSANQPLTSPYVGKSSEESFGAQPYLADSFNRPQIKLHFDMQYGDDFSLFSRYTQSGQLHHFREFVPRFDEADNLISLIDERKVSLRSFIISPEYLWQINDQSSLTSSLTFDTQEYIRYRHVEPLLPEKHTDNIKDYAFAQNRWVLSSLYSYEASDWNMIAGYEYENIHVGAPLGKSDKHLFIREGVFMVNDRETSVYTQDLDRRNSPAEDRIEEIGSGLYFYTHSFLLESNFKITDTLSVHYGQRIDLPDASSAMFSPRFSLTGELNENQTLTGTLQRAARMMPLRAQYLHNKYGNSEDNASSNDHETIDAIELSYSSRLGENSLVSTRVFYNDITAVGFTGRELRFIGDLEVYGLELEATYKTNNLEIIANHSYLENKHFSMAEDLKTGSTRNNISFSDYYYITRGEVAIPMTGYGEGINNWSKNTSKFIVTQKFNEGRLLFQLNMQVYWDYEGAYDEMRMYQQGYNNYDTSTLNEEELAAFNSQRQLVEDIDNFLNQQDAYKTQINIGASLSYNKKINNDVTLSSTFYVQNLLDNRYRYYVSTGSSQYYPNRLNYMKEPTIFGVKFDLQY